MMLFTISFVASLQYTEAPGKTAVDITFLLSQNALKNIVLQASVGTASPRWLFAVFPAVRYYLLSIKRATLYLS